MVMDATSKAVQERQGSISQTSPAKKLTCVCGAPMVICEIPRSHDPGQCANPAVCRTVCFQDKLGCTSQRLWGRARFHVTPRTSVECLVAENSKNCQKQGLITINGGLSPDSRHVAPKKKQNLTVSQNAEVPTGYHSVVLRQELAIRHKHGSKQGVNAIIRRAIYINTQCSSGNYSTCKTLPWYLDSYTAVKEPHLVPFSGICGRCINRNWSKSSEHSLPPTGHLYWVTVKGGQSFMPEDVWHPVHLVQGTSSLAMFICHQCCPRSQFIGAPQRNCTRNAVFICPHDGFGLGAAHQHNTIQQDVLVMGSATESVKRNADEDYMDWVDTSPRAARKPMRVVEFNGYMMSPTRQHGARKMQVIPFQSLKNATEPGAHASLPASDGRHTAERLSTNNQSDDPEDPNNPADPDDSMHMYMANPSEPRGYYQVPLEGETIRDEHSTDTTNLRTGWTMSPVNHRFGYQRHNYPRPCNS